MSQEEGRRCNREKQRKEITGGKGRDEGPRAISGPWQQRQWNPGFGQKEYLDDAA